MMTVFCSVEQQLCSDAEVEQEPVLIFAHILYLKPKYLPKGASAGESECDNRIRGANLLIVFHGSV